MHYVSDIMQRLISKTNNVCHIYLHHSTIYQHIQVTHIQMKNSEEIIRICLYATYLLYNSVICLFLEVSIFFHHYLLNAENRYVHAK